MPRSPRPPGSEAGVLVGGRVALGFEVVARVLPVLLDALYEALAGR